MLKKFIFLFSFFYFIFLFAKIILFARTKLGNMNLCVFPFMLLSSLSFY